MTDSKGEEIPFQFVRGDQINFDDIYHTAFIAEVPAWGYAVYRFFTENDANAEKKASELNFKLPHIMGSFHKGKLPEVMSCFECDNENIIVTAVKQSEDDNEIILRAYKANGEKADTKIKLLVTR